MIFRIVLLLLLLLLLLPTTTTTTTTSLTHRTVSEDSDPLLILAFQQPRLTAREATYHSLVVGSFQPSIFRRDKIGTSNSLILYTIRIRLYTSIVCVVVKNQTRLQTYLSAFGVPTDVMRTIQWVSYMLIGWLVFGLIRLLVGWFVCSFVWMLACFSRHACYLSACSHVSSRIRAWYCYNENSNYA